MEFEIWEEGYMMTGSCGTHRKVGTSIGDTFEQACDNYVAANQHLSERYQPNPPRWWGCQWYDNATDAAKAFG